MNSASKEEYGSKTFLMATALKAFAEHINQVHLTGGQDFDPTFDVTYTAITRSNLCAYLDALRTQGGSDYMLLNRKTCESIGAGWGKEV